MRGIAIGPGYPRTAKDMADRLSTSRVERKRQAKNPAASHFRPGPHDETGGSTGFTFAAAGLMFRLHGASPARCGAATGATDKKGDESWQQKPARPRSWHRCRCAQWRKAAFERAKKNWFTATPRLARLRSYSASRCASCTTLVHFAISALTCGQTLRAWPARRLCPDLRGAFLTARRSAAC